MKVSVCIPVFNGDQFIEAAVDSVLGQTYKDFELIIVDNQSTDNTVQLIRKYTDPRIRFFQNDTNIGLIPNWNMAMSKASGEYIKILPADDILYPDCLALQVAVMDKDTGKRISMVCGGKNVIDQKGRVLLSRRFARRQVEVPGTYAINKNMRSGGNIIGEGGSVLFRREILLKTGPFDSPLFYVLDIDQWYKILLHGNLYALPQIVSAFRVSAASESTKKKDTQNQDLRLFMKKIYADPAYKVSWLSYRIGLMNAALSTIAKKLLYRFHVKDD
jgi:glycosyltransferase involved in cell wall biosynthesis